jgi:hypothetical protein
MKNKNKKRGSREDIGLRNNQAAQTTSPVNLKSGDRLRENPSNDEETIKQDTIGNRSEQSPLSRKHEEDGRHVTNEDDQQEIVNPSGGNWDEPEKTTEPGKDPYEGLNEDPGGTQRKIPNM